MRRLGPLIPLPFLLLLAGAVFLTGIDWGLPSRSADEYLFPGREAPTGAEILRLAGGWGDDDSAAADVDRDPLARRDQPIALNDTEARRAAILLRYRLYSAQPDEMITFRALARMRPGAGDLDPRLYQYGGLWIYPVGALLRAAAAVRLVHLAAGQEGLAYYLNHPEDFGRFYLVARAYSAAWGLVGVVVVFFLARRLAAPSTGNRTPSPSEGAGGGEGSAASGGATTPHPDPLPQGEREQARTVADRTVIATAAAMLFVLLPVTVNLAHEAKPHLAGAVLVLATVLAAARYVDRPLVRRALVAGAAAGAAAGMVLTGLVAAVVPVVMVLLAGGRWKRRLGHVLAAGAAVLIVFAASNPYLLLRLGASAMRSNLSNVIESLPESGRPAEDAGALAAIGRTCTDAARLVHNAITWPVAVAGLVGFGVFLIHTWRRRRDGSDARRTNPAAWLLIAPAAAAYVPFLLLARDRPAEFARFAMIGHIALLLAGVALVGTVRRPPVPALAWLALLGWVGTHGLGYLKSFHDDARGGSRQAVATVLSVLHSYGYDTLWLYAEPAPYCLPPVDLESWRIILMPPGAAFDPPPGAIAIRPVDRPPAESTLDHYTIGGTRLPTPMSWASKPFEVRRGELRMTR